MPNGGYGYFLKSANNETEESHMEPSTQLALEYCFRESARYPVRDLILGSNSISARDVQ